MQGQVNVGNRWVREEVCAIGIGWQPSNSNKEPESPKPLLRSSAQWVLGATRTLHLTTSCPSRAVTARSPRPEQGQAEPRLPAQWLGHPNVLRRRGGGCQAAQVTRIGTAAYTGPGPASQTMVWSERGTHEQLAATSKRKHLGALDNVPKAASLVDSTG